jgi:hypothetical protein
MKRGSDRSRGLVFELETIMTLGSTFEVGLWFVFHLSIVSGYIGRVDGSGTR